MKISELKKKYTNVRFCELKIKPDVDKFVLSNVDEFLDITQKVGYIEETFGGEGYVNKKYAEFLTACLNEHNIRLRNDVILVSNYISEHNLKNELKLLIASKSGTNLYLYSLDSNAMYEDLEVDVDDDVDYEAFAERMDEIIDMAFEYRESCVDEVDKAIRDCILNYKNQYNGALTKVQKEKIVQAVQIELKERFGLDYRNDTRAVKVSIENLLNK